MTAHSWLCQYGKRSKIEKGYRGEDETEISMLMEAGHCRMVLGVYSLMGGDH